MKKKDECEHHWFRADWIYHPRLKYQVTVEVCRLCGAARWHNEEDPDSPDHWSEMISESDEKIGIRPLEPVSVADLLAVARSTVNKEGGLVREMVPWAWAFCPNYPECPSTVQKAVSQTVTRDGIVLRAIFKCDCCHTIFESRYNGVGFEIVDRT